MTTKGQLPRSTPEAQGIASSAIQAFLEAAQQQIKEFHSFILVRHGSVVAEGWWKPYAPDRPHMLFSLSKSFTSTAVGFAVSEGLLSVEDYVISFFPDDAPAKPSKKLAAMRVRHLLSMSTGHAEDTMGPLHQRRDGNWTKAFLAQPVKYEPGTHFLYNTGATYMLSAIVQKLTGKNLLEYLQPRLFTPLGIKGATWEMSPQGICTGGFGLSVTTEDIARFGQLYLQKGMWNGKRIIAEAWVDEATTSHISNGTSKTSDWEQGYGYQFWRCRHKAYRGDGAFGQYCIVMPEQDAVLAITSGLGDMQPPLNLVWTHLLPAMKKRALPENAADQKHLKESLDRLAYLAPTGKKTSPTAARVSGKTYTMAANPVKIKSMGFEFEKSSCTLTVVDPRGKHVVDLGLGSWREGSATFFDANHSPLAVSSGVWTSDDTFVMTLRLYETPFIHTISCHFVEDRLEISGEMNVNFGPTTYSLSGQIKA